MTLEELRVVISASTEDLRGELNRVRGQLNNLSTQTNRTTSGILGSFKKLVAGIVALKIGEKIGQAIFGGIKDAMAVEAALQQIKRIMGESTNQFLKWANTQAIAFNMSKGEAIKYGSVFGNLLMTFTKNGTETMKYTEDLLKASSIIASATGRTMTDVMERIRSGLLGNTEAIEDLGVNVNVAMIQSTEAFKKFAGDNSWDQLSFQTQQQIRLMAILEQTNKKYGDTVNQNTSSQLQQLVAQLNDVKLSLVQAFLPIVRIVLPMLTALAQQLNYVMGIVAQFSEALFGKSIQTGNKQTQNTQAQAKAMTNLGNATEKAGKQAKGALAGFDEINSVGNQQSGGSGVSGGIETSNVMPAIDNSGLLDSVTEVSAKVQRMADKVKASLEKISFLPLIDSFERLKTSLEPFTETLFSGLNWAYTNIFLPLASYTISELLPAFLDLLSGAFTVLNPLVEAFKPFGQWLWDNFLSPIATFTGGVIVTVLEDLGLALNKIGTWMSNNKPIVEGVTTAVVAFMVAWKATELFAFIELSGGAVKGLTAITTAIKAATVAKLADKLETMALTVLYAKDFVVGIGKATAAILVNTAETLYLKALYGIDMVKAIGASIVSLGSQALQWGLSTAAMVANKVALVASTIAQAAMTAGMVIWNTTVAIGTAATTAFNVALAVLTSPITLVITAIAALVAGIVLLVKNWDTVKEVAANVWDGVKTTWLVASKWFGKNVVDPIAGLFKSLWNGIISGMNFVIRGLNKIHFDFPDWVPGLGSKSFGIKIPEIPKLAKGGIVDSATIAMVGEAGKEAVMPLENNTGWITELADKINARGGNTGNSGPLTVVLRVGKTDLARVVAEGINDISRQTGELIIDI